MKKEGFIMYNPYEEIMPLPESEFEPSFGPPGFGPPPVGQMPLGPPPSFAPSLPPFGIGTSGIQSCLFRNTYIWMFNGTGFWFFLTAVGREFIAGFRWSSRSGWRFQTIARRNIRSYECSRW